MGQASAERCEFETARLRVAPWHRAALEANLELEEVIADMLTTRTTSALPEEWRGDFTVERAVAWVDERDGDSPTLLAIDRESGRPVGLLILFEVPVDPASVDLRIGYVIAEEMAGRGLATELVAGLVDWARGQSAIQSLTGGVEATNAASARVLSKNGFEHLGDGDESAEGEQLYRLEVPR